MELKSQEYIDEINTWSTNQKIILNQKKTKLLIFNFTDKYQFSIRLKLNCENIYIVNQTKLLDTIITGRLRWDKNCRELILRLIYITYCFVILEGLCEVWQGSLTKEKRQDLERYQKSACRVILGNYNCYKQALLQLDLEDLDWTQEGIF